MTLCLRLRLTRKELSFSYDVAYLYDQENLVAKVIKVISAATAQLLNDCLLGEA